MNILIILNKIIFGILVLPLALMSQTFNWNSIIHGGGYLDACMDQYENVFCVGVSNTLNPVINNQPQTGFPLRPSGIIVKYQHNQTVQWIKVLSQSGENQITSIAYSTYAGIWICGTFSDSITLGTNKYYSPGIQSMFLAKLDPNNGNILWSEAGISTTDISNPSICISLQHEIIFIAQFNGTVNLLSQTFSSQGGGRDIFCMKISRYGLFSWRKEITSPQEEFLTTSVHCDQDGNIYIAGNTNAPNLEASGIQFPNPALQYAPAFIVKLNSNGDAQWLTYAYISNTNWNGAISKIITDENNNVYFSDSHCSNAHYDNIYLTPATTATGITGFGKLNSLGKYCWVKQYMDPAPQIGTQSFPHSLSYSAEGNIYLGGMFYNQLQVGNTLLQNYNQGSNSYLIQLDTAGLENWAIQSNGAGSSYLWDIVSNNYNQIYCLIIHGGTIQLSGMNCPGYHAAGNGMLVHVRNRTNKASGTIFFDTNGNGTIESGEAVLPNKSVYATHSNTMTQSDIQGKYELWLPPGSDTILSLVPNTNYYISTSQPRTVNFAGNNLIDSMLHIGIAPVGNFNDLELFLTKKQPINLTQTTTQFQLNYFNSGTTQLNATIQFIKDYKMAYGSAIPSTSQVIGDTAIWNIGNLAPLTGGSIVINISLLQSGQPGEAFIHQAIIYPIQNDNTPVNNTISDTCFLDESSIGNTKVVSDNWLAVEDLIQGPELYYTIYFQNNTGNISSDLLIIDTISQWLDLSTFAVIGSSHLPLLITECNRELKFRIQNIQLPDSATDPVGSCGFVKYRIKPYTNIPSGNTIYNAADIYFDYNEPVRTDLAYTYIAYPTSNSESKDKNLLKIYPNPVRNNKFTIDVPNDYKTGILELYSPHGELVIKLFLTEVITNDKLIVSVPNFATGIYLGKITTNDKIHQFKIIVDFL